MVAVFGSVFLFSVAAMAVGVIKFLHDIQQNGREPAWGLTRGQTPPIRDAGPGTSSDSRHLYASPPARERR